MTPTYFSIEFGKTFVPIDVQSQYNAINAFENNINGVLYATFIFVR